MGGAVEEHAAGHGDDRDQEEGHGVRRLIDRDRRVLRRVDAVMAQRVEHGGDVEQGQYEAAESEAGHDDEGLPAGADDVDQHHEEEHRLDEVGAEQPERGAAIGRDDHGQGPGNHEQGRRDKKDPGTAARHPSALGGGWGGGREQRWHAALLVALPGEHHQCEHDPDLEQVGIEPDMPADGVGRRQGAGQHRERKGQPIGAGALPAELATSRLALWSAWASPRSRGWADSGWARESETAWRCGCGLS